MIGSLATGEELEPGRGVARERHEGEVEASFANLFGHGARAAGVADVDVDAGVLGAEGGDHACQVDGPHPLGLHRSHHHRPP
jgi:hypothetical protein